MITLTFWGGYYLMKKLHIDTRAIHSGYNALDDRGSLATPIYQTSTFVFENAEQGGRRFAGEEEGYIYTRLGNPTVTALEEKIADLEGGEMGVAFGSGMAAISAVLIALVKSGDHILATKGLYGCTFGFLEMLEEKFQVSHSLVDFDDWDEVEAHITPTTKVIYLESPINPTMKLIDFAKVSQLAKRIGAKVVVDNTFCSPYIQRPLEQGCDVVVHSATKYIGGHGDVIAGLAVGSKEFMAKVKLTTLKDIGGVIGPFDAWLLLRGLKTLHIRMDRHSETALKVAQYLENHPLIEHIYYPFLPSFPQYDLAVKQMRAGSGVMSFELKGGLQAGITLLNHMKLAKVAVSLGDAETLIQHPASMTHSPIPREERLKMNITDGLIRFSVGLEHSDDIIADLTQALEQVCELQATNQA